MTPDSLQIAATALHEATKAIQVIEQNLVSAQIHIDAYITGLMVYFNAIDAFESALENYYQ